MSSIEIRVGAGIVEVWQLDDCGCRTARGLEVTSAGKAHVKLSGPRAALLAFAVECESAVDCGFDWPATYYRSCKATAKQIRKAIAAVPS